MTVAIIGAGYAGMAAAVELAARGIAVDVFEASRTLGGRARGVDIAGMRLDNGAHLLVGAYRETLRLTRLVGVPASAWRRTPLHLEFPGHFRLAAPRLPAPWHVAWALLTAHGLDWRDKWAAVRFMRSIEAHHFRLAADLPAAQFLASQPERVRRYLWDPLCLAALNTPPERASAQVFLNVLRDSLAANRAASDLLLPTVDLSALFPEPAARYLTTLGSRIRRGTRIQRIERRAGQYWLDEQGGHDQVILAVAPQHVPGLLGHLPELAPLAQQLAGWAFEPITTCYLAYPPDIRLPTPMAGIAAGWSQWLFDLGSLRGLPGVIAAVISARIEGRPSHEDMARRIHEEIAALLPGLPAPRWHRVIEDKRATFACAPNLPRPATATALPGLWLAGDYVAGDYPATIEGAVRSGLTAARSVLQQASRRQS